MQIIIKMALFLNGVLISTSIKALKRMINDMVSKYINLKLIKAQLMPNIKMISEKVYG
jgi:hypothetical protein